MPSAQPRFGIVIKPMFRESDRSAMGWKSDLWSYDEVKKRVHLILSHLTVGEKACDGRWSPDKVAVMGRWIESRMPKWRVSIGGNDSEGAVALAREVQSDAKASQATPGNVWRRVQSTCLF